MRSSTLRCLAAAGLGFAALAAPLGAATFFGPTPYTSFAGDSPFNVGGLSYFHLENFEDGALNTPGLSAGAGVVAAPSSLTDSVDADDGVIDGSGTGGRSWFSGGLTSTFVFDFDAGVLGGLPTLAGLVWTDVGQMTVGDVGFSSVVFEAFGPGLVSLGTIGPSSVGDGSVAGQTGEDRFFGVSDLGGIQRIVITIADSTDWEVDHVQYGRIPAPGSAVALGLLGLLAARPRRR